jgi:hypothetical protein
MTAVMAPCDVQRHCRHHPSQAALIAVGIDLDDWRQILAAEMVNRESRSA